MDASFIGHSFFEVLKLIIPYGIPIFRLDVIEAMDSRCCLLIQVERCLGKKPCCSFLRFSGACIHALALLITEMFKDKCRALFRVRNEDMNFPSDLGLKMTKVYPVLITWNLFKNWALGHFDKQKKARDYFLKHDSLDCFFFSFCNFGVLRVLFVGNLMFTSLLWFNI